MKQESCCKEEENRWRCCLVLRCQQLQSSIISKVGSANIFANSQEGKETEVGHLTVRHQMETSNGDELQSNNTLEVDNSDVFAGF